MVEVGGPYLLEHHGLPELPIADKWRTEGAIILHVVADGEVIAPCAWPMKSAPSHTTQWTRSMQWARRS